MSEFYVGWWNLENLFDIQDSPRREKRIASKIKKQVNGWTEALLDHKISQLSKIIKQMNGGKGPDILGVCEVENKYVLEKLVQSLSSLRRDYIIVHEDTIDGRGVDVAFLYDSSEFEHNKTFQHWVIKRSATRELFQVNLVVKENNEELVLVGNHWPARSAGIYVSEPYRMLAGETLSYWMSRILEEKNGDIAVVVMGDFNDEPYNRSIIEYARGSNNKTSVKNSRTVPKLYNLMWQLLADGSATYFHRKGVILDQFMVSKGFLIESSKLKIKENSTKIEAFEEMTRRGRPRRFGSPNKKVDEQGFSDHFPISTIIVSNK